MSKACSPFIQVSPTPPPPPSSPGAPTAPGGTRLIVDPTDLQYYSVNKECDARTALTRGLREYLEQLSVEIDGRLVNFIQVFDTYPDFEDSAKYPSALVYSQEVGAYDASKFTTGPTLKNRLPAPDNDKYLVSPAEYVLDMKIELWATDNVERAALCAMLEDAMAPVLFIGAGVRLELPHYHGQRAEYEMISHSYMDNSADAMRRYRVANMVVRGRVPVTRIVTLPTARIKTRVTSVTLKG